MNTLRMTWVDGAVPHHLAVTQVYGYCFDDEGRVLLIQDAEDRFGLPGGKPEGHETYEETLRREVIEEAQIILGDIKLCGYQLVEGDRSRMNGAPYAQVRTVARIISILPAAQDPATGWTYRRVVCPPAFVPDLLQWNRAAGTLQMTAAFRLARRTWGFPL